MHVDEDVSKIIQDLTAQLILNAKSHGIQVDSNCILCDSA